MKYSSTVTAHKQIKVQIAQLEEKNKELTLWLYNNTKHPDFGKIASDRNNNNFKRPQLQDQLDNWNNPPPRITTAFKFPQPNTNRRYY